MRLERWTRFGKFMKVSLQKEIGFPSKRNERNRRAVRRAVT